MKIKSLRILTILFSAVLMCAAGQTDSRASVVPDEWDEVFDTARAVLAKLPDAARIEDTVKKPALREALLRTHRALKDCAKVHPAQGRAVKQAALAEFDRSFKVVQTEIDGTEYQTCAGKCRDTAAACEKGCESARKKLCSCKITEFGCFVTQCVFA